MDRFDDLVECLGDAGGACWCMSYRMSATDYGRHSGEDLPAEAERRADLMRIRCASTPAPGVLAYVGGKPVGWCGVGPRPEFIRLVRSRTIPAPPEPDYWTVVCYVGTVSMFEAAGFRRVAETAATSTRLPRWVVRHQL